MLNDYQKGSIFGAILVAIAFAFSFATYQQPSKAEKEQERHATTQQKPDDSFWPNDPVSLFTFGLVLVGLAQAGVFIWQAIYLRRSVDVANRALMATIPSKTPNMSMRIS